MYQTKFFFSMVCSVLPHSCSCTGLITIVSTLSFIHEQVEQHGSQDLLLWDTYLLPPTSCTETYLSPFFIQPFVMKWPPTLLWKSCPRLPRVLVGNGIWVCIWICSWKSATCHCHKLIMTLHQDFVLSQSLCSWAHAEDIIVQIDKGCTPAEFPRQVYVSLEGRKHA